MHMPRRVLQGWKIYRWTIGGSLRISDTDRESDEIDEARLTVEVFLAGGISSERTKGVIPFAAAELGSTCCRGVVKTGKVVASGKRRRVISRSITFTKPVRLNITPDTATTQNGT
jgi:hypothetical protein